MARPKNGTTDAAAPKPDPTTEATPAVVQTDPPVTDQADDQPDEQEDDDDLPAPVADPDPIAPASPAAAVTIPPMTDGQLGTDSRKALLLDACERFDVVPFVEERPRQLAGWKFYPGSTFDGIPNSVVIVTAGGVKLRHFEDPAYYAQGATEPAMDQDTEEILAKLFGAYVKDAQKGVVRVPLRDDLALPPTAKTGLVSSTAHQFRKGYLREGGKAEADRRVAVAKAARKK